MKALIIIAAVISFTACLSTGSPERENTTIDTLSVDTIKTDTLPAIDSIFLND